MALAIFFQEQFLVRNTFPKLGLILAHFLLVVFYIIQSSSIVFWSPQRAPLPFSAMFNQMKDRWTWLRLHEKGNREPNENCLQQTDETNERGTDLLPIANSTTHTSTTQRMRIWHMCQPMPPYSSSCKCSSGGKSKSGLSTSAVPLLLSHLLGTN